MRQVPKIAAIPKPTMKLTNFAMRGPIFWNTVLDVTIKEIDSVT